jgi:hypothetical protein
MRADSLYFSLLIGGEWFAPDSFLRHRVCNIAFSHMAKAKITELWAKFAYCREKFAGENRTWSQRWPCLG